MPEILPKGWIATTLGEIAEPSRERGSPTDDPAARYVGLEHIEPHSMRLVGDSHGRQARSSSLRFSKGDVLYGKMRPYLNKVWVAEFDGLCSAEFIVFKKRGEVNSRFFAARLNAEDFVEFSNGQASGERPRVDFEKLSHFQLLLPPLAEQKRITDKLSAAFASVDRANSATSRASRRLQRYRTAVLHSAVDGELTREWREAQSLTEESRYQTGEVQLQRLLAARRQQWETTEFQRLQPAGKTSRDDKWKSRYPDPASPRTEGLPDLPDGWIWASLDQLGELNRGKSKHRPRDDARLYGGPYPFIQTGDVRKSGGTIREHTQTYSEFGLKQSRLWPTGTLCITIAATIAETGILTYPACFPDSIVGFVQDEALLKVRLVEFFIRSEKSELERYAPATAQKNINLEILEGLAIPLPPFAEQIEIIRQVERRLSATDRLLETLERQDARADITRQALLRRAFDGQLVPQSPANDEPASVLIERIRAARQAEAQKPKGKSMSKARARAKVSGRRTLLIVLRENGGAMTPEDLFHVAGHSEETVDDFFAELRELTAVPAKIIEERRTGEAPLLRAIP